MTHALTHQQVVGTARGFAWHQHRGTEPCALCKEGKAEYDRMRNLKPDVKATRRRRNVAVNLARKEIIKRHHAEYRLLYLKYFEALGAKVDRAKTPGRVAGTRGRRAG